MKLTKAAVLLILIQVVLVSTIAGKFLYERRVCPRVWTRAAMVDPDSPLRGRYLSLPLSVDACGFAAEKQTTTRGPMPGGARSWNVDVVARRGGLVAQENRTPAGGDRMDVWLLKNVPCERAVLRPGTELYIPDTERLQPLKAGQELWVEVTVPPAGPPRAIQLAVSGNGEFRVIHFN